MTRVQESKQVATDHFDRHEVTCRAHEARQQIHIQTTLVQQLAGGQ